MRVSTEHIEAFAHCAAMTEPGIRCEGYEQQPVSGLRETTEFFYSDGWGGLGASDPYDAAVANLTERTVIRILFAAESDRACPSCGSPREISDQLRPQYDRLSDSAPDELLKRSRRQTEAALTTADAATRQAVALEQLVAQGSQAGEVEQLRAIVAQQQAQIDRLLAERPAEPEPEPNGHTARPARKRAET